MLILPRSDLLIAHPRDVLGISTDVVVDASYHNALMKRRAKYTESGEIGVDYLIRCLDGQEKMVTGFTLIINYEGEKRRSGSSKTSQSDSWKKIA